MENEEAIGTFQAITGADQATAQHVLEAHGWDLNNSVEFFMESAGMPASRPAHGDSSGPMPSAEPFYDDSRGPTQEASEEPQASPAFYQPTVPPMPSIGDDEEFRAALAASMRDGGEAGPGEAPISTARSGQHTPREPYDADVEAIDDDVTILPGTNFRGPSTAGPPSQIGSDYEYVEDEGEEEEEAPRTRHSRRLSGVAGSSHPMPLRPRRPSPATSFRSWLHSPPDDVATASGNGYLDMPSDVNLEEAKMLEAAMMGMPYEGRIPDFRVGEPAGPPSPTVLRQRELREEQDQAYQESLQADREKASAVEAARRAQEEAELRDRRAEESAALAARNYEEDLERKEAALPPEPAADDPNGLTVMIRLPNGARLSRRFLPSCDFQQLFSFVDVRAAADVKTGGYRLVTQYPRRVFGSDTTGSLAAAGLSQKQEALFLEPL